MDYPANPNGSAHAIAGICNETGRLFGLMPHPEAFLHRTNHPRWTRETLPEEGQGLAIFKNAVAFIPQQRILIGFLSDQINNGDFRWSKDSHRWSPRAGAPADI